jgi:hypothetical protein
MMNVVYVADLVLLMVLVTVMVILMPVVDVVKRVLLVATIHAVHHWKMMTAAYALVTTHPVPIVLVFPMVIL